MSRARDVAREFFEEGLLPNRAGQAELEKRRAVRRATAQRRGRCERIERAAREIDRTWDELMRSEEEEPGQFEAVVVAVGRLRKALDS